MLYLIAIVTGVIAGLAAGGRLNGLFNLNFRKGWLILASFAASIIAQAAGSRITGLGTAVTSLILTAIFCVLMAGLWYNRQLIGIWLIALGSILNFLVMLLNGGRMPVSAEAVRVEGIQAASLAFDIRHMIADIGDGVRLAFLADIIRPPFFLGFLAEIVSLGDIIVIAGVGVIFFEAVSGRLKNTGDS